MLLFLAGSVFVNGACAQTEAYFVTVKPTADSLMYAPVGKNLTFAFEATWSFGDNTGQPIPNATVTFEVYNIKEKVIDTLEINSSKGVFFFNYSSPNAGVFKLMPTKLVTEDQNGWNIKLLADSNVYGLRGEPAIAWWDTFNVELVNYDATMPNTASLTLNLTYLLIPQEGLTLPAGASYNNKTFLPKTVQEANVTVNGVNAQKTNTTGIYVVNVPIWLPTAFVHVSVSQEDWTTKHTGFSFSHSSNEPAWIVIAVFGSLLTVGFLFIRFAKTRRQGNPSGLRHSNFPYYGGVLLAASSVLNLYWGVVLSDCFLHGFDWLLLAVLCFVSFVFGVWGCVKALKQRSEALVIFAVVVSLFINVGVVKAALDMYQLATPWLIIGVSVFLAFASGVLVSNADQNFKT